MGTLEKLGLILMIYAAMLHTMYGLVPLLLSYLLLFMGSILLLVGRHVTQWLVKTWRGIQWE